MRRFILLGHKAPISPDFILNDLPGSGGRLDVLCRAIGATFFLSHDLRRDTELTLLLQNQVQIRFVGERLRGLNPDERSTAGLIKSALEKLNDKEVESTPGIFISRSDLPAVLDHLFQSRAQPVLLHEDGIPIDSYQPPPNPAFVLSDHLEFTGSELDTLSELPRISLGGQSLHASQCITIVHYLLDRRDREDKSSLQLCHKVWGEPKAKLIQGLLKDFDIPANLITQVPPSVLPMTIDGLAEVRIMVRDRDLARAKEIIADYFEEPTQE
jgi:tRNA (pseudouridine54-N1)-methyltransferase